VLAGGVVLTGMFLVGCASRRLGEGFPQPRWPDQQAASVASGGNTTWYPPVTQSQHHVPTPSSDKILPRSAWTRGTPRWSLSKPMHGVQRITIHHDAMNASGLSGQRAAAARMEKVRRSHLDRGPTWVDIGYHYVIDPDGRVWEGRPASIEGAHVSATNEHNLGIMLMGNFQEHRPTQAQLTTLDNFVAFQMRQHRVPISRVFTHRELKPTECPGRFLQPYCEQTRSSKGRMAALA
jgi:hypothetical protein